MRNLAGRLNARSTEELSRIAAYWQVPISGRDRHAIVGQLYSEMRDPRTARDVWERLDAAERELVRLLALDDRGSDMSATIEELARATGRETDGARTIAISLYRKGIVYREGDDDELPIGEIPRVFLPRELTAVFRRIQDEIDAGDVTTTPLTALLALLDDVEIEHAAEIWGAQVVPGLRSREELIEQILDALTREFQRGRVTQGLRGDARRIWDWMTARQQGGPVQMEIVIDAVGLGDEGAAFAQRRREALGELEGRILVWHSYDQDGSRRLFVPAEVTQPKSHVRRTVERPEGLNDDQITASDWRHPYAVAWDLMTLIRALHLPDAPPIYTFDRVSSQWLSQLNERLWNASEDGDEPPAGYLAFLAALASNENVIEGGGPGAAEPMTPGRSWKLWRSRSFVDQLAHLLWWWNASPEWIEGQERGDVVVEQAAWPQLRRKLLVLLATLDPWSWYRIDHIARWVVTLDPDILGPHSSIATSGAMSSEAGEAGWARQASAAVVSEALRTAFSWFGLIELGTAPGGDEAMRTMENLRQLEATNPPQDIPPPPGPAMEVHDDLVIELRAPTPIRVWAISAFADQSQLRPEVRYQINEASLERAFAGGATMQDVLRFLESQSGESLPEEALHTLQRWSSAYRRVWLRSLLALEPDDQRRNEHLMQLVREAGWEAVSAGGNVHVTLNDAISFLEEVQTLRALLAGHGYSVQETRPPSVPESEDRSDGGWSSEH